MSGTEVATPLISKMPMPGGRPHVGLLSLCRIDVGLFIATGRNTRYGIWPLVNICNELLQ